MVGLREAIVAPFPIVRIALEVVISEAGVVVMMDFVVVRIALVVLKLVVVCPGPRPGFLLIVVNMLVCTDENFAVVVDFCSAEVHTISVVCFQLK